MGNRLMETGRKTFGITYTPFFRDDPKLDDSDSKLTGRITFNAPLGEVPLISGDNLKSESETKTDSEPSIYLEFDPGYTSFKRAYQEAGADPSKFKFFTKLARLESNFNSKAKNPNAPAYGYFQFMQGSSGNRS